MLEKCGWRRKDVWSLRSQANQHLEFGRPGWSSHWNRRLRDSCILKAKWRKYFKKERMWSMKSVLYHISQSVQFLSRVPLFATPWTAADQASLSITNSRSPLKPMSIELVMTSNHLILCHPLLLLPSIFPNIRVFSKESVLHMRWAKYWRFSFNISHYFTSMWDECNCVVVWAFFGIAFLWVGMKTDLFQSCGHCWVFQICWHIECSTFTPSSLRIWDDLQT